MKYIYISFKRLDPKVLVSSFLFFFSLPSHCHHFVAQTSRVTHPMSWFFFFFFFFFLDKTLSFPSLVQIRAAVWTLFRTLLDPTLALMAFHERTVFKTRQRVHRYHDQIIHKEKRTKRLQHDAEKLPVLESSVTSRRKIQILNLPLPSD